MIAFVVIFFFSQRVVFQKMSPHETLFRLEATQNLERAIVDHTPLCRFTVWDFPGDYYGEDDENNSVFECVAASSLIFVVDAQAEPYDQGTLYKRFKISFHYYFIGIGFHFYIRLHCSRCFTVSRW